MQASNTELHAGNEELVTLGTGIIAVAADLRVFRFSGLIAQNFELESRDLGRGLRVMGPRLDVVDLAARMAEVVVSGESQPLRASFEATTCDIKISLVPESDQLSQEPRAVLVFENATTEQTGERQSAPFPLTH